MRFSEYYLPQFYDATVTKAQLGPANQDWIGAKTWRDGTGNNYIEFTARDGKKYYVYTNPEKKTYLRVPNSDNIYWDENSFWDFVEKNGWTPDPTDVWTTLEWMPRTELKRTVRGGPVNVIGWENLKVGTHKIPIRKSLSENPMYYAKLKNGNWVPLTPDEYNKLKGGDMKVLHNKVPIQFYKDGGKVLKMQNAATGNIPVTDMTGTYSAPIYQDPASRSISGWDKAAIIGTGVGTGSHIIGAFSTNPKVKRVANIASLLGYGTAVVGNTVSDYQNTGQLDWGSIALSAYGIARGVSPRPAQRYYYHNNIPTNVSASRGARMWKGVQNYGPKAGQWFDVGTGLAGTTFGTIGTFNLIDSIANDPNKTWDWNTWTTGDARNFQLGMTGISPIVAGTTNRWQNARMRKHLPQTSAKLGSLDEINFARSFKTKSELKTQGLNYIKTNPIKEAYLGNPYNRALNVIRWNNPIVPWKYSTFTLSPSSIGLTGGLYPWQVYSTPQQPVIEDPFVPQGTILPFTGITQPVDTLKFNGGLMYKKGGSILKMQNAATGKIPGFIEYNGVYLADPSVYANKTAAWNALRALGKQGYFYYNKDANKPYSINSDAFHTYASGDSDYQKAQQNNWNDLGSEHAWIKDTLGSVPIVSKSYADILAELNGNAQVVNDQILDEEPAGDSAKVTIDGVEYDLNTITDWGQINDWFQSQKITTAQFNEQKNRFETAGILPEDWITATKRTLVNDEELVTEEDPEDPEGAEEEVKTPGVISEETLRTLLGDGDGEWSKALKMTGSLIAPMLELGKFHQAWRTASQNGSDEREALRKAINLRQKSAKPLMQFSSDFSKYDNALTTGIGQLNSSFRQFANSTSDNNQVLSGFNSYASNLSKLVGNYTQAVGDQAATDRKQNLALFKDWSDSEYTRVNENNALVAEGILGEAKSLDTERQAKSGHINTMFNTFQDWITKDKATGSNLNELLTLRESIVKQGLLTGQDVTSQLAILDQRINEARQNSRILPSFSRV